MSKLKTALVCLLALLLGTSAFCQGFGERTKFNSGWKFSLSDSAEMALADYDDSRWRSVDLPHDWSVEGLMSPYLASCTGYLPGGIGWYRKHFTINDSAEKHFIYFEGVYNRSEVYLNGHLLGRRPNGYISFMYELTPYLQEGENVLSVRVDHSLSADSRWYTGSGIYRDVYLVSSGSKHFDLWGVSWKALSIKPQKAVVQVDARVVGESGAKGKIQLNASLTDAQGRVVASGKSRSISSEAADAQDITLNLTVLRPELWDLERPYLYSLQTELLENGNLIDSYGCAVGLRTLEFDADKGFALNGKNMKVKGVCLHHDAGVLGSAVPEEVWERRLIRLKELGVNAIRCSHNPQAPVLYDLCDSLGFLVMDEASDEWEFPKRKWIEGWNVGTPGYQGSYDFFEEWIETDVADMVRRDRNHPCIFLWSIGNEVDYPNDPYSHPVLDGSSINQPMFGGYKKDAPDAMRIGEIARRLSAVVRSIDTSRPVTGALAGVVMSNQTAYPSVIDVVGYNYTEDRYDIDHQQYPERIIYGSENGMGYDAWKAVVDRDFIFGQFLWTGLDYLGESGRWPSRGLYTGLLDYAGNMKPRGWFRASLWSDKKTTYIGTYPYRDRLTIDAYDSWNYEPEQRIRVVCYTNSPQARLLLDGKPYGEMKPYDASTGIIAWDVDFKCGTLTAQGCSAEGDVESEYSITTSLRPYRLVASCEESDIAPGDLVHINVEVLDENGVKVLLSDNMISCTVGSGATLVGLESGSNTDTSDHRDASHRAHRGSLLAYVRVNSDATVSFSSPLLEGCSIELKITR